MARNTAPDTKVMVFIDGQNVYKTCQHRYGHPCCHPLLLADRLVAGRRLVGIRYYSGLHDPRVNPDVNASVQRRHHLIRASGVTVVERQLRYRWEWGFDQKVLPKDARKHIGKVQQVDVSPFQRAREKGIDLALALDVVDLALQGMMDTAIVVSADNDLCEVARMVHAMTARNTRVSVEAAVFNDRRSPVLLTDYDYTNQLKRADFDATRDTFDYRVAIPLADEQTFLAKCQTDVTVWPTGPR